MYKNQFKRVTDFLLAFIGLILLFPVLVVISFLLLLNDFPFFLQKRVGKRERIFNVIKFKTMNDKKDNFGCLLPDNKRLTRIGKFIRKTSLDEIPQLINVLKGEMSIVGPRPLLEEYLPLYNSFQRRRHEIRPGITGLAQIKGRNRLSWNEKFEYDIWYVDHISLMVDLRILIVTVFMVFKSEGINSVTSATMERFTGN